MSAQNPVDPFHVARDVTRDNINVVRRQRLVNGGRIRAQTMYATAALSGLSTTIVNMPYEGNLNITVSGATNGDTIVVRNPFVTATTTSELSVIPGGAASAASGVGQVVITLTTAATGVYVLSVGNQNGAN